MLDDDDDDVVRLPTMIPNEEYTVAITLLAATASVIPLTMIKN